MVRSYLDLTIKFHDYSSFFTTFDVATLIQRKQCIKYGEHVNGSEQYYIRSSSIKIL